MKTDQEYIDYWHKLNTSERIKLSSEIESKFNYFRSLGFTIDELMSSTHISYDGVTIYYSKKVVVHFLKAVDFMEEYVNK